MANKFTVSGTNIDDVKKKNQHSGMSYNEAKEYIARTTGGHNTNKFSNTNAEQVRNEIQQNQR
ncbi:gamma-type small acid-soluble spore protein [Aquibacillus albus]|uniref:Small, acid-soluble spore protein gamma-type n=1 Tax=Aquibacillus albus TaxID=1168171 RepID=A0ABS2MXA8_9BACI|nr:gamma-type small acid-soluble spore protein [Aquibacillus albus]MBM7570538.1 hypothetical protein [Aquibacillus albus]